MSSSTADTTAAVQPASVVPAAPAPLAAPATHAAPATDAADLVTAGVDDLIPGRQLRFPLCDADGLLLLAEGTTITADFKRALEARNISSVQVHRMDFRRLTFRGAEDDEGQAIKLDAAVVEKLDSVVDAGLLFVVNSESALFDQVAQHGCKSYDRQKYLDRINRNKETSVFIDNLMRNALRGKSVDSGEVTRLTASYLNDITSDIDSTLSAKLDAVHHSAISDHCVSMAVLGMALGVEMGLDAKNVRTVALAGLLHDWGMIRVPEGIREKTGPLTEDEHFEISKHPVYTLRILEQTCGVPMPVPLICYQVHERPNGNGYPQGRPGPRIHVVAKILAVADAYNALISPRPFRPPLMPYAAMECILRQAAAGDFDPQAARALLKVQSLFPIGSYVVLSDGSVARVIRRNQDKFTRPIVRILQDADGKDVPADSESAVVDLDAAQLNVVKTLPSPGSNAVPLSPEILNFGRQSVGTGEPAGGAAAMTSALAGSANAPARRPCGALYGWDAYSDKQRRQAMDALDVLENASRLGDQQFARQRTTSRTTLRMLVNVCVIDPDAAVLSLRSGQAFRAMARDISSSGIAFIHCEPLPVDNLLVGLPMPDGVCRWFLATVVRRKEIGDTGFWEHGAVLRQRVQF